MSESERENIIESLGQGGRGAAWVALYLICWILMAWSCSVGLPSDCLRAEEPTEVLIELSVLVCFALAQVRLTKM